ncbi:MAG: sigma-E processing peptidase SpoIIGA [Oscillospiraceae bacterium]|jgi:hypothetical protein|nr:sigma-E processing peptidase SpoIIGA [Oscillospiraceae bacterium]
MISIELFFLLNSCMDAWLILIAIRWLDAGKARPTRVAAASALGGIYACAAWSPAGRVLLVPPISLAVAWLVIIIALGRVPIATSLKGAGYFMAAAFLTGGVAYALTGAFPGVGALLALSASAAAAGAAAWALGRNKRRAAWRYGRITLRYRELQFAFDAAVDSGNHALDPYTGLPVVIAPHERLRGAFPALKMGGLPEGMRLMPLSTVSGTALVPCFTPDVIAWKGEVIRASVAIAPPQRINVALAPSCLGESACAGRGPGSFRGVGGEASV